MEFMGIKVEVRRADFAKYFPEEKNLTDALVQFDHNNNVVTVDERADEDYVFWAAIHEAICCGGINEFLETKFPDSKDPTRCCEVEKILLAEMPADYRLKYIDKRIEMFQTLLRLNLNPDGNPTFDKSLEFLVQQRNLYSPLTEE